MKPRHSQFISVALCFILMAACLTGSSSRAIAQKHGLDIPVTTGIKDVDPITLTGYRIESDSLGLYHDGVNSVQSILQASSGDWVLNTDSSPIRKVFVDFRDPVPISGPGGSAPTPPFSFQQVPARLIAKAHDTSAASIAGMIGLGTTLLTPLSVAFTYGGNSYGVRMNPANFSETNYALVTCTGVVDPANPSTSKCNQWKIEPGVTQPDGQNKSTAKLVRIYTVKNQTYNEDHGDFYMSFSISITNP